MFGSPDLRRTAKTHTASATAFGARVDRPTISHFLVLPVGSS